jgi:hypothetical protein
MPKGYVAGHVLGALLPFLTAPVCVPARAYPASVAKPGSEYEDLVELIFRALTENTNDTVERNVRLESPDGMREIDVLVRSSVGPIELTTIVEARDFARTINVTQIDGFHSKIQDVRASKGVMVTRGGYSKTARQKAARLGITLLRADQYENVRDTTDDVPVLVREIRQNDFAISFEVHLEGGTTITQAAILRLNDVDLPMLLRDELLQNPSLTESAGRHTWTPAGLGPPWFIRDVTGKAWSSDELTIDYGVAEDFYFGYLSDLDKVLYLHDVTTSGSNARFLVPAEKLLLDYQDRFVKYSSTKQIPVEPRIRADVVLAPTELDLSGAFFRVTDALTGAELPMNP